MFLAVNRFKYHFVIIYLYLFMLDMNGVGICELVIPFARHLDVLHT